jgi:hypothetical protein
MLQEALLIILNELLEQHNMADYLEDNATVHEVQILVYQLLFNEELSLTL